jgi:hypothetical protein
MKAQPRLKYLFLKLTTVAKEQPEFDQAGANLSMP